MRRIGLAVVLAFGLTLGSLAAEAQQPGTVYRIGFLGSSSASTFAGAIDGLRQGLRDLGWVEGRNITLEFRWAEDRLEQLPDLATDLVRTEADVIMTQGTPAAIAAKNATRIIPIVFVQVGDPVGSGVAASLARPGGNLTGLTIAAGELSTKRLELLKEAVPKVSHVAVLWNPGFPPHERELNELKPAAQTLRVELQPVEFRRPTDFESAFATMRKKGAGAVLMMGHPMTFNHATRLAELAAKAKLPAISLYREFVQAGGLMGYGASVSHMYRHAATYVDKILKGAKPADLPIEQPSKFEFVINLKTAKALGLTIPQSLLLRADQVIE
jgi:putative ABC transport system substrate-binding protein